MPNQKPRFFSCYQINPTTQEVTEMGQHPGPSAQEVADTLSATLPEGQIASASGEGDIAFSFGKVSKAEKSGPHFIVFIGDGDVWVTTSENEVALNLNLEEYDRKEAYSPDLHVTFRSVVTGTNLLWTPKEEE